MLLLCSSYTRPPFPLSLSRFRGISSILINISLINKAIRYANKALLLGNTNFWGEFLIRIRKLASNDDTIAHYTSLIVNQ